MYGLTSRDMVLYINRVATIVVLAVPAIGFLACSEFETGYYQGRVNEATQEVVAGRYGVPHDRREISGGRTVWTYFDRGSGTSGYTGYAQSRYCRAYVLTFDEQGVLRDWQQEDCSGRTLPPSALSSDRK